MKQRTLKSALFYRINENVGMIDLDKELKVQQISSRSPGDPKASRYYDIYENEISIEDLFFDNMGDGTVPYYSANRFLDIKNTNSRNWVWHFESEHTKIVRNSDAIAWVIDILNEKDPDMSGITPLTGDPYTVIRAACPVNISVTDGVNVLSSVGDTMSLSTDFGEMYLIGRDRDIKVMALDSGNYHVDIAGTDTGKMDYSLRFFDERNTIVESRDFYDVPITENTRIRSDTNFSNETCLEVEEDGNASVIQGQTTRHYLQTSTVHGWDGDVVEVGELSKKEAEQLYRKAPVEGGQKCIGLTNIALLPQDVMQHLAAMATADQVGLQVVVQQLHKNKTITTLTVEPSETSNTIFCLPTIFVTKEKKQYLQFPLTLEKYVIIVHTNQTQAYGGKTTICIYSETMPQLPLAPYVYAFQNGLYEPLLPESWMVSDGNL